ncbi:MAG: hypothetical protein KDB80_02415 [Planctomycetes bacterium]|nr:hypothetical protein [Planctomycetota bacterium]
MNVGKVPRSLARRAVEAAAWLDFGCPEHALVKLEPLLESPGARPFALKVKVMACSQLARFADALAALADLKPFENDLDWFDVTEAWCRKRSDDLPGAIRCMERLVDRDHRSAIGHFNLGCYLALAGEIERALDEVSLACGIDGQFRGLLADERDLDALRDEPGFRQLLP